MEYINMTEVVNLSPQQFLLYSHKFSAIPSLLILFVITSLIFLLVGLFSVEKHSKFMKIWIISTSLSGAILLMLIYLPNAVQSIVNIFR